ncbi:MAG: DNA polymerase III subunit beta [Pseudomonadota bacterium]
MRLSISRETLLPAINQVMGAVERRQTLPILGNLLIEAHAEGLRLTATDLEMELVTEVSLMVEREGATTIPARKLLDICRTLPEGCDITLSVDGAQALIQAERSRFQLSTLPAEDFPRIEALHDAQTLVIRQGVLKDIIQHVAFAMAQQDVRYYLNGMLLELAPQALRGATTDGHRLALCEAPVDLPVDTVRQVIVPRKGVIELQRLLGEGDAEARIEVDANHLRVDMGTLRLTSKLVDGRFPDYQRVIPTSSDKRLIISREALRQAMTRASILSSEKFKGARFTLEGDLLSIETQNPERENSREELLADYKGEPMTIGFNIAYLLDVLNTLQDPDIILELRNAESSGVIHHQGSEGMQCTYVIMPMRL